MPSTPSTPQPNPHDAFVKSVFHELPHARGLFRGYLPPTIDALLDWKTLRLERDSFLSDELASEFADLLFSIRFRGDVLRRRLRLLFEHKRRRLSQTPRQLHRYISRQFEQTPSGEPLPCILTVVLLQYGRFSLPTLSSEYRMPESIMRVLSPYLLDFQMLTIELSRLGEAELRGTEVGRLALAMLKTVGEGKPLRWLQFHDTLRDLCSHLPPEQLRRELRRALYYLTSVTEPGDEAEIRESLLSMKVQFEPIKESVMTLLEHLEQRGLREGRVQTLVRQMSAANPEFSESDAAKLRELPDAALDELTDAIALHAPWKDLRKLLRKKPKKRNTE
jgi:hypothetical protein